MCAFHESDGTEVDGVRPVTTSIKRTSRRVSTSASTFVDGKTDDHAACCDQDIPIRIRRGYTGLAARQLGLSSYWALDKRVGDALGIPRAREEELGAAAGLDQAALQEAGENAVLVHVASGRDEPALDELEEVLGAAVEDAGAGRLEAVRPVLKATRLPMGSCAIVRYGDLSEPERCIDLT